MILCGLWHNAIAQAGLQQYYYMGAYREFSVVPIASYQTSNNWYMEARYNYEALNSFSLYYGKTFEKTAPVSYQVSPILGFVAGSLDGGSVGMNLEMDYNKLNFNTQSQYTFSIDKRSNSYVYSWSDLTYQLTDRFAAGVSLQQTKLYQVNGTFESGILVKAAYNAWTFPLYIFRPGTGNRYFVLGINYQWQKKP